MEKRIVISLIIAFTALTGCSSDKNASEPTASSAVESQASANPTEAPTAAPKKLSATEAVALDYVNIFLNGSDMEAKKNFITQNVYPDAQPVFQMAQAIETPDNHKLKILRFSNPWIIQMRMT